ncbi:PREDICTED: mitochondrial carrier protein MTM1 [Nicotiana attenuata]|uniref:Mitochondrial carrier protein mtm1 n=1 Tax=Nicotiana attenuata TaxID=49451 RepID=A0A1J6KD48_NICAT|nr:PREDICTED: mitochondrial carrier protein MTM1 [Nicotiana attenuata]XP_019234599.1 PREDICTED: mitochondrial carrier protein MTM1 [Nicotiana attenuata]OIT26636.1 mitochondrial carrier protein mtm1 [Nicotiana attenuata]
MVGSTSTKQGLPSWIGAASATRTTVEFDQNVAVSGGDTSSSKPSHSENFTDVNLRFGERAISAAGAAVLSAVLVNPLDVAKTRLQAQAAGVPYDSLCSLGPLHANTVLTGLKCNSSGTRAVLGAEPSCSPDCSRYKGTLDVFYKVIRQEGVTKLWRGTNASLTLAIPSVGIYLPLYDIFRNSMEEYTLRNVPMATPYVPLVAGSLARSIACVTCYPVELARTRMQAFRDAKNGVKPPGVWKTLLGVVSPVNSANSYQNSTRTYRLLWTGLGAQLARDVPFSAICWSTLEPVRRKLLGLVGDEASATTVLGANFSAGFIAGSLAAAATCPLDVARTRRQIENDPERALRMTTRQTLVEIWRDGGAKGLFTGVGPRVARAGPSVGIVVSFYEVVKYALRHRHMNRQSKDADL